MDLLTHAVLGAAIGEVTIGKKTGRKSMLWGATASILPDVDVLGTFVFTDAQQLFFHRGITHSFTFIILVSMISGWFIAKWAKRSNVSFANWTVLFLAGTLSHILLDSLTCYGTGWFEPFNHSRISFNTIFVADPFYTLPLLICLLVAAISQNGTLRRMRWAQAGLAISSLYLVFTMVNHAYIHRLMEKSFSEQKLNADAFTVTPAPLNNFLWMAYSQDNEGGWIGYYSVFDKDRNVPYYRVHRNDSLLASRENDEQLELLKQFSKGNYSISMADSVVYFYDLRFGNLNDWGKESAPYAFRFNLGENADNARALNRLNFSQSYHDVLLSLVKRIKGK